MSGLDPRVVTAPRPLLLKTCGITDAAGVDAVAAGGAHLAGLWFAVPGGRCDLEAGRLVDLAARARWAGLDPVLVTFSADVELLHAVVAATGVRWVQLHAYQPPAVVASLRERLGEGIRLVKVLHVAGTRCVERRFVPAYERTGIDVFLLDAVAPNDGTDVCGNDQIGSTGHRLDPAAVVGLAERMTRPFLLAGGITAERGAHQLTAAHPLFAGVDVDTGARDAADRLCPERIRDIATAWTGSRVPA